MDHFADVGAGVLFLFPHILRLRTKKDKRTLSIKPDKLSTRIGALSGDIPWNKMEKLYITDEYVFLIRRNMNGFAIPRRAFVHDTQRSEFIRLSGQYLQQPREGMTDAVRFTSVRFPFAFLWDGERYGDVTPSDTGTYVHSGV